MDRETAYVSSIPELACEKVTERHGNKSKKRAEYHIGKELVGIRTFHRDGALEGEWPFRNGVKNGWEYRWDDPGELLSATPYENGVEHGTAYQWGGDGRLIGSYTMERGTGTDLWWNEWMDGKVYLTEVYQMVEGLRHGFEWHFYIADDLYSEQRWFRGVLHGIERDWNTKGGLSRGYPRYWVQGERVTKAKYVRAALSDDTLPPFRPEENKPFREFPPEVARHLWHIEEVVRSVAERQL